MKFHHLSWSCIKGIWPHKKKKEKSIISWTLFEYSMTKQFWEFISYSLKICATIQWNLNFSVLLLYVFNEEWTFCGIFSTVFYSKQIEWSNIIILWMLCSEQKKRNIWNTYVKSLIKFISIDSYKKVFLFLKQSWKNIIIT